VFGVAPKASGAAEGNGGGGSRDQRVEPLLIACLVSVGRAARLVRDARASF